MKKDQIRDYNFDDDQLDPIAVMDHLRSHDAKMEDLQAEIALVKATYTTKFWRHIEGHERSGRYSLARLDQIEVNRLKPAVSGYLSALYPRRIEVVLANSPYTTGDAKKAEMVVNDWINQPRMRDRVLSASRQALLYKGAGAKIGYDPAGEGLNRVWMRIFPWWEMILDKDVHDQEDARFIGHISYRPKREVAEEYGLAEENLGGSNREDYLSNYIGRKKNTYDQDDATSDNGNFVRVLEFCNLVDDYKDTDGTVYKGRLEIYVLDEGYEDGILPVYLGPLPLVDSKNQPLGHICPLIFEHEPEYPYRGLSYAEQLMPQQKELNALRSFTSIAARRDSRIYLAKKGALDADAFTDLKSGEDGLIIEVDEQFSGSLRDTVVPIQHGPISSNLMQSMAMAENDLEKQVTLSPAALGVVTKATAEEVRAVERHTESEFGRHAEQRDLWLQDIVIRCLAAHVAAMYDTGDSEGAEEHVDEDGVEKDVSEETEETEETGEEKEEYKPHMMYDKDSDDKEYAETEEEHTELQEEGYDHADADEETAEPERKDQEEERVEERKLMLRTPEDEFIEVSAKDLDSDFDIGFSEAGRTPASDAELRNNLVALMDRMIGLYQVVVQGGPMAILAEQLMFSLHERFQLPPNLHPDYLKQQAQEQAQEQAEQAPPQQQPEQQAQQQEAPPEAPQEQAPPQAPQEQAPPPPQSVDQVLQQLEAMNPDDALLALEQAFADNPDALAVVKRAQKLPDRDKPDAVKSIIQLIRES
tara:strand:+ start:168 stop:2441 length:2274 start_codon:yes stop_codon:yes gene_type:complete